MRKISIISFILIWKISVSLSGVVDLDSSNFDSVVDGSKAAFVEFFAPWCGHCKHLAPEYEIVGDAFERLKDQVVIAKVDADEHKELGSRFDVHGFPTLKFFPKGSLTPEAYDGGRTADDIIQFINNKAGTNARVKKAPSAVTILDDENFDKIALDPTKDVLVEFYAPWCGHCKKLAPDYEKVAAAFASEPNVVVANLDADSHKIMAGKYGVSGFPTIKWFGRGNKESPELYEQGRDVASFVSFINEKAGTKRKSDGRLEDSAGRISSLDEIATKFVASGANQAALIGEAQTAVKSLKGEEEKNGKYYVKIMETIKEKGNKFVTEELARLSRLLDGSLSPKKSDELTTRKNILVSFSS